MKFSKIVKSQANFKRETFSAEKNVETWNLRHEKLQADWTMNMVSQNSQIEKFTLKQNGIKMQIQMRFQNSLTSACHDNVKFVPWSFSVTNAICGAFHVWIQIKVK